MWKQLMKQLQYLEVGVEVDIDGKAYFVKAGVDVII